MSKEELKFTYYIQTKNNGTEVLKRHGWKLESIHTVCFINDIENNTLTKVKRKFSTEEEHRLLDNEMTIVGESNRLLGKYSDTMKLSFYERNNEFLLFYHFNQESDMNFTIVCYSGRDEGIVDLNNISFKNLGLVKLDKEPNMLELCFGVIPFGKIHCIEGPENVKTDAIVSELIKRGYYAVNGDYHNISTYINKQDRVEEILDQTLGYMDIGEANFVVDKISKTIHRTSRTTRYIFISVDMSDIIATRLLTDVYVGEEESKEERVVDVHRVGRHIENGAYDIIGERLFIYLRDRHMGHMNFIRIRNDSNVVEFTDAMLSMINR